MPEQNSHSLGYKNSECVILLHGLARGYRFMKKLARALDGAGFIAVNIDYPSTKFRIEKLARDVISNALEKCPPDARIHFVTHSMGGILVRHYLHDKQIKNLGRVVMLGPPNQGSQVVDKLHRLRIFKLLNGPAGMQLGTDRLSTPKMLDSADFDLGIIAGTCSINPVLSLILPNPNDGKVSVDNTKLKGMTDHIVLPVTHTFMMNNRNVINQVIYFLKNGVFGKF